MTLRLKPADWMEMTGINIVDRDGWRDANWEAPVDLREFYARCIESTLNGWDSEAIRGNITGNLYELAHELRAITKEVVR